MDILFINPPYRLKRKFFNFDVYSIFETFPPLSLAYLAASCKKAGYSAKIIDMEVEVRDEKRLLREIEKYSPKIIGITCLSSLFHIVIRLSRAIKKRFNLPVIVGGVHANIDPEGILKIETIDYVLRGEGEYTLVKLLDFLIRQKGNIEDLENLSFKKGPKKIHNIQGKEIDDIDAIPFPDRSLFNYNLYFGPFKGSGCATVISSRGCPFNCNFCSQQYKKFRRRTVKNVILEIKEIVEKYGINNIEFFDETFNLKPEYVNEFCDTIIEQGIKINFRIRGRPDLITDQAVRKLKQAGCYTISLGIESAHNQTLKFFRKGYTVEQIKRAVEIIKKYRLPIHGYFILGSPTESKEAMLRTIKFSKDLGIELASFSILTPMPGTDLYREAIAKGWYRDEAKDDYSDFIGVKKAVLRHPTLSSGEEIENLLKKAYYSFYLRPKNFLYLLKLYLNPYIFKRVVKRFLIN